MPAQNIINMLQKNHQHALKDTTPISKFGSILNCSAVKKSPRKKIPKIVDKKIVKKLDCVYRLVVTFSVDIFSTRK